jgi:hypothetical protein
VISCDAGGDRTYGVPTDVAWTDTEGSFNSHGRPACLPPGGTTEPVLLHWVETTADDVTWRAVVHVTCL